MSEQQFFGQRPRRGEDAVDELLSPSRQAGHQDSSLDDLLDQIDEVIDRNPEGYVRGFVQRGGQ